MCKKSRSSSFPFPKKINLRHLSIILVLGLGFEELIFKSSIFTREGS